MCSYADAGPRGLWRIHSAVEKSSRSPASVFLFSKKDAASTKGMKKKQREELFEAMRRGPAQLQKLRHPDLLRVVHPLTESKDLMAYATEPVLASLANLNGAIQGLDPVPFAIRECVMDELERRLGLVQLSRALAFVHTSAKLVHGNISPSCVFVMHGGHWKLGGFHYCFTEGYVSDAQTTFDFPEQSSKVTLHPRGPWRAQMLLLVAVSLIFGAYGALCLRLLLCTWSSVAD